ncbi:uncharacterized protein METZ01_LOCUS192979, partial [marine metagenome]
MPASIQHHYSQFGGYGKITGNTQFLDHRLNIPSGCWCRSQLCSAPSSRNPIILLKFQHILIAVAVATIFGMGIVITKPALDHFPPMFLLGMRFVFSAAILVWFFRPPWADMKNIFLASLIGSTLMYGLMFNGLKLIDASLMIIVVQLQVPFASLLAWFS